MASGGQGKRMNTENSIGTRHSSTRQRGLLHSLLAPVSQATPAGHQDRTLSLTGLAMFPLREWGEVSLEDSGPPIAVQFSYSVVSDSLRAHGPQHVRPPCPSPTPEVYPNSCPSSR